jgi:ABC-type multidrug transport system fused ATPase/permease subunit
VVLMTRCSDRVMVLDAGQIAEFASPRTLLEDSQSIFAGMCKAAGITGMGTGTGTGTGESNA